MSGIYKTLATLALASLPSGNSAYNLPRPRAVQFDAIPPARWHHTGTAAGKRAARKARNRRKAKR
ncbi:hypothetical protein A7P89_07395 [Eikenella corrodens]|uniref:Uncharacterized protein n=2 Tax=Eikenella corrodens TaxID=539 RepID=A0A1A9RP14_EIKCO|nr:hypothetical protein A7P89_07395 [Eikenella corrodens]